MIATQSGPDAPEGRLVDRALEQLRAHPVYLEVCGPLAAATVPNDPADPTPIIEPLLTTRDGLILEGHERWAVARQQGRPSLPCIEYDLTGEEALTFMLEQHRRSERLNDFCRIVMALALEPHWRARARERQRQGGTGTLSSKLTKGHAIDVRAELARAAGVGAGKPPQQPSTHSRPPSRQRSMPSPPVNAPTILQTRVTSRIDPKML